MWGMIVVGGRGGLEVGVGGVERCWWCGGDVGLGGVVVWSKSGGENGGGGRGGGGERRREERVEDRRRGRKRKKERKEVSKTRVKTVCFSCWN